MCCFIFLMYQESSNITQESDNFERNRLQQNMFGLSNVSQPLFSKSDLSWSIEERKKTHEHTAFIIKQNVETEIPSLHSQ